MCTLLYTSAALCVSYIHILVVKIGAIFRRYAFIWCGLALVSASLFHFGFCFYVSIFSKYISISFEYKHSKIYKQVLLCIVNTETDHLLYHQELVFFVQYQTLVMFVAHLYSKNNKHQGCCQVFSTSNGT